MAKKYPAAIVSKADAMLKENGLAVGDDYAKRWLLSEANLTPGLGHAFDHRHDSPEALRAWKKLESKALDRLWRSAKSQPSQEATEDRAAITAAVKGASRTPPPEKPPNYAEMDNIQFRNELKKYGL